MLDFKLTFKIKILVTYINYVILCMSAQENFSQDQNAPDMKWLLQAHLHKFIQLAVKLKFEPQMFNSKSS